MECPARCRKIESGTPFLKAATCGVVIASVFNLLSRSQVTCLTRFEFCLQCGARSVSLLTIHSGRSPGDHFPARLDAHVGIMPCRWQRDGLSSP